MLREVLIQAWIALTRNKLRSFLTMLGIVWGISAVALLIAYGNSFRSLLVASFDAFGKGAIIAWPAQTSATDPENNDYRLFTFYSDNFVLPLDTRDTSPGLGPVWVNYVKGVKIFLLSDIAPAEIPSPFGIQTNVNLRNISKG